MHCVQLITKLFDVFDKAPDLVVQGAGLIGYQSGIFVLLFVTPDVLYRTQRGQQVEG